MTLAGSILGCRYRHAEAGRGRADRKAGHLAGDKDTHLAKMKTKGVEQAVQHHEEKEEYEHTQIVYWHHPLICDV